MIDTNIKNIKQNKLQIDKLKEEDQRLNLLSQTIN